MGCSASDQLSQDLQRQNDFVGYTKNDKQVDRFQVEKPQQGAEMDDFFNVAQEKQQQFMAVKPWIGALVAPTQKPEFNAEAPQKTLQLQFVNGYKVEDSRQNMFWGKNDNEIVYCAAALGINMNVNSKAQKYMGAGERKTANGHSDDIMSLGVCPSRKMCVTGSLGSRPQIIVWDSQSMEVKARTKLGRNTRAVSTIRFSKDGKHFFCSDKHNDSNVYCFKTEDASKVGEDKCGSDPVFDADTGDDNTLGVATKRGVYLFMYDGSKLNKKRCLFGDFQRQAMITITWDSENKVFQSGTNKGSIFTWKDGECIKSRKVHEGSVRGLQWANGCLLSSGSKDHKLHISKNMQVVKSFDLPAYANSLDFHHGKYLVAASNGGVGYITESGEMKKIMQGHSCGQTWGLAIGQGGNVFTTADDNKILQFNPGKKMVEGMGVVNETAGKKFRIGGASTLSPLPPNQHSRAVAVNKKGHVAIGTNDGALSVRSTGDLNKHIFDDKPAKEWIQILKYSPQQNMLAVGSHDNNIYIYSVDGDNYSLKGKLSAHNSFITNFDWSCDGKFIQSNCGAYQLLFFDVAALEQMKSGASSLNDEKWATYSVKLGWYVQGIFPRAKSGDHVNGVDRNKAGDIIATGCDWGFVNLYRNPALKGAKCNSYRAHSSHVVRVAFDGGDNYLYSTGGYDKTLMMWKVC